MQSPTFSVRSICAPLTCVSIRRDWVALGTRSVRRHTSRHMVEQSALNKRLLLYIKNLVGHGWQIISSAILGLYSLWTLFAPETAQRRFLMVIYVDPQHRLELWLAVICVFLFYAGFRAWDDEHSRAESSAEGTSSTELRQVRMQLAGFQAREWPRLIGAQKSELASRLRRIGPHTVWIVRPNNLDCVALAADFDSVFRDALWNVPASEPYSIEEQKLGITVQGNIVQEAVRTAIVEATALPATVYRRSKEEGNEWSLELVVLSIGPKVTF